ARKSEYVVPKHTPGIKAAASGSKHMLTCKKVKGASEKKTKISKPDDFIDLSSSDGDNFINWLMERKETCNLATAVIMDRNCKLYLAREQIAVLHQENNKLWLQIRNDQVKKVVQQRLKDLRVSLNPTTLPTASTTSPDIPTEITNDQIHLALQMYLQDNNLKLATAYTLNHGALWEDAMSGHAFNLTHPFQFHLANGNFDTSAGGNSGASSQPSNSNAGPAHA
ncbi:hypothetical protein V565_153710, partial [Rhizoctonia solani 123E]